MKIGDKVYCYNIRNGKNDTISNFKSIKVEVGQTFTITDICLKETAIFGKHKYVSLGMISFPIRKHGSKKKCDGIPVAYFDKFFMTQKEFRRKKLKRLNKYEGSRL